MSEPSETGGRPLASTTIPIPPPEGNTKAPSLRRKRTTSQSSDERVGGTQSTSSRRRPGPRTETSFGPHTGSSRGDSSTMQRSASPSHMSPEMSSVNYTRTGRISKAKKGLKVHNCECGRSYTRAEHLRRHQKNHAQDALVCEFPDCGKTFYRLDLLQRHQERHNEIGKDSRRQSFMSQGSVPDAEPQVSAPIALPPAIVTTLPQASPYYPQTVSPLPESTNTPSGIKQRSYGNPRTSVQIPIAVDGHQGGVSWSDPFSQSPNYSSSSGYASPIPGPGDYANMFANPPYGPGSNRTRTSSNASFIEPWGYPSRSPTSATSTMAYTWTSNDSKAPSSLAYMNTTSYPLTSMPMAAGVDPMSGYGHFGPKSMAQRDEEEQAYLFPEQSFGMGVANTYPFELYFDNYWRLFHPSFPVVHRATFDRVNESPMLRAAMIAVGAQYSNDPSAKRKSRILHDRCTKLLDKRPLDVMTEPERLCDYQALFLVEVLSQYRARRAAKNLSARFETLYQRLYQDFGNVASNIGDIMTSLGNLDSSTITYDLWNRWAELAGQQRLLQCCYILEYQQATFLARSSQPSMIPLSGFDLPLPSHYTLWEAQNPMDWAIAAQQNAHLPAYVYNVPTDMSVGPFDHFQSLLLIAAYYNHFSNPALYLSPPVLADIEPILDSSPTTKHQLLTAKLLQVTPVRALLAVSGESWILSEKVPSPPAFSSFKATLKTWVNGLWSTTPDPQSQAVKDALRVSIELLQHAISTPSYPRPELGADMGLYFAALVIWAVTVASNTRINAPQPSAQPFRYQSHSPITSNCNSNHFPTTPTQFSAATSQASVSPNPAHPANVGLMPTSPLPSQTNSMLTSEITSQSIEFLTNALLDLDVLGLIPQWPRDVVAWQTGCASLMRWVKMRLRGSSAEGRDSAIAVGPTSAGTGRGGDGLGELLDGVVSVLEKIMGRGWEGWGV